ncbi:MAG: hypothetical protein AB1782_09820, partial [Cyanobacteriota bacterium]
MSLNRSNLGQGAVILFAIFIVVILLIVGVTLSTSQTKAVTRVIYSEANLKTYYAAMAGIQEALATRLVPRSNVYAIQTKLGSDANVSNLSTYNMLNMTNGLASKAAPELLPPLYPNTGVIYGTDPGVAPNITSLDVARNDVIGTYLYKAVGGELGIDGSGKPTNDITGRVTIFSVGYSLLPDNKVDRMGLVATVDFDRSDDDPTNADEIESLVPVFDPGEINTIEANQLTADSDPPEIISLVTFTGSRVGYDLTSYDPGVPRNTNPGYNLGITPNGAKGFGTVGSAGGTTIAYTGEAPDVNKGVSVGAQFRITFDEGIDPRSLNRNPNLSTPLEPNISMCRGTNPGSGTCPVGDEYTDFTIVPSLPLSNTVILVPSVSYTNFLDYEETYYLTIRDIYDFEGNKMDVVNFEIQTEKAEPAPPTPTPSDTLTNTYTETNTPSDTLTSTSTVTDTSTLTSTLTASNTLTSTNTYTPSNTYTDTVAPPPPTSTFTYTFTVTPSNTYTSSNTYTASNTYTPTSTYTPSNTY